MSKYLLEQLSTQTSLAAPRTTDQRAIGASGRSQGDRKPHLTRAVSPPHSPAKVVRGLKGITPAPARKPIFQEEWWCEAACPGTWKRIIHEQHGSVDASLIVWPKKVYGQTSLEMPYYARAMEPEFISNIEQPIMYRHRAKVLAQLIEQLPRHDRFFYTLPPGSEWILPFNLLGFKTEFEYTFRYHLDRDPDPWKAMNSKMRNKIRLGQNSLQVETHQDFARFDALSRAFLKHKGRFSKVDYGAFGRIFAASAERGQAAILTAVDDQDRDVASSVLLWDDNQLYYWLSARDAELSKNFGNGYLIWAALQIAAEKGLEFDIDGFASPEQGRFLTMFGLTPVQRTKVIGESTAFSAMSTLRSIAKVGLGERAYAM